MKFVFFRLWDVERGTTIATIPCKSSVRTVNFSFSGNQAAYSTDKAMGYNCELFIIDVRNADSSIANADPILRIPVSTSKITSMLWGSLDETIITGHENGQISLWDLRVCDINKRNIDNIFIKTHKYIFSDWQRIEFGQRSRSSN